MRESAELNMKAEREGVVTACVYFRLASRTLLRLRRCAGRLTARSFLPKVLKSIMRDADLTVADLEKLL